VGDDLGVPGDDDRQCDGQLGVEERLGLVVGVSDCDRNRAVGGSGRAEVRQRAFEDVRLFRRRFALPVLGGTGLGLPVTG
jgi:hypothetical protein